MFDAQGRSIGPQFVFKAPFDSPEVAVPCRPGNLRQGVPVRPGGSLVDLDELGRRSGRLTSCHRPARVPVLSLFIRETPASSAPLFRHCFSVSPPVVPPLFIHATGAAVRPLIRSGRGGLIEAILFAVWFPPEGKLAIVRTIAARLVELPPPGPGLRIGRGPDPRDRGRGPGGLAGRPGGCSMMGIPRRQG
jgi:hypothetical protein